MNMKIPPHYLLNIFISLLLLIGIKTGAQNIQASPEYIKALTAEWKGERFTDGRPKISDSLLERLKKCTLEEVWAELIEKGYHNQFEGDWKLINDSDTAVMTGRAVTAQFIPARPDLEDQIILQGKKEGRIWEQRRTVSWAVNTLVEGDVYVADGYDKPQYGTVIGSNLGTGVYNQSKRGVIVYGHVRDMEDLRNISGFNGWIKGSDPSYMRKTLLISINAPVRIGEAVVLPGDAVLAKKDGVIFIPPHLVNEIVLKSEVTALFDVFGQIRIREKRYTAGQIDSVWSDEIKQDFKKWLNNYTGALAMPRSELDRYLKERNF